MQNILFFRLIHIEIRKLHFHFFILFQTQFPKRQKANPLADAMGTV